MARSFRIGISYLRSDVAVTDGGFQHGSTPDLDGDQLTTVHPGLNARVSRGFMERAMGIETNAQHG